LVEGGENLGRSKNIVNMSDEEVQSYVKDLIVETQEYINEEKFDMVAFSRGLQSGISAYLTPQMVNANLKSINLNPQVGTYENILEALQNPNTNEDKIIAYSQNQYLTNTLYKRNTDYYASLLAFNLSIQCKNAKMEDYDSKPYEKDLKIVENFLNKFDYKSEFKKAVVNMLNADIYPCMFRTDMSEDKWVLQDFPYRYAKITGRFSHGIICDYDLSFLLSGTQSLDMYPKWLKVKFNNLLKQSKYNPASNLNSRTGTFALYTQTSPEDGAFCFKYSSDYMTEIPYLASMIPDTSMVEVYRTLQLNQNIASARKIITSQWPMLKDAKNATGDNISIRVETMGKMIGACMGGLNSNGELFNLIALPSDKIEVTQMENKNQEMYQNYLKTVSGLLGGANVLFSTQKQTSTETLISSDIDRLMMERTYNQFENFLDYYINRLTKRFKFEFKFSGTNLYVNKEARMKEALDFAKVGIVSINKLANALDLDQFQLRRELEMGKASKINELFLPLLNPYVLSGKENSDGGRPKSSTSEISDSGIATRDTGANENK